MLVIKQKINNNALEIFDDGIERVIIGKGVGFLGKVGEVIDPPEDIKIYTLDTDKKRSLIRQLMSEIPLTFLDYVFDLIEYVEANLNDKLNDNLFISLADHLYNAVNNKSGAQFVNAIMLPEMKMFYPKEFTLAKAVVEKTNYKYNTQLDENEVGFITMHIINSQLGQDNSLKSLKILEITKFLVDEVSRELNVDFNEESLVYNRLLIHLRFLAKRTLFNENYEDDQFFFNEIAEKREIYQISSRVLSELATIYDLKIDNNEKIYLAIHLERVRLTIKDK